MYKIDKEYQSHLSRYYARRGIYGNTIARYIEASDVKMYCEVFGGGAPAMLATDHNLFMCSTINDYYQTMFAFVMEARTNREAFLLYCKGMRDIAIKRGYKTYCKTRAAWSETGGAWTADYKEACDILAQAQNVEAGYDTPSRQEIAWATKRAIEGAYGQTTIQTLIDRLQCANLESLSPPKFIKKYGQEDVLLYADPPYADKSNEFSDMLEALLAASGRSKIIIRAGRGAVIESWVAINKWHVREIDRNMMAVSNYELIDTGLYNGEG